MRGEADGVDGSSARRLREIAVRVAGEAAELVREQRRIGVGEVHTKTSETDVVTAVDQAAERLVRLRLAELRPGEPVLGEEQGDGADGADPDKQVGGNDLAGLRWVVDPIDGTVNFLYGYPWYGVSLAAQVDGVSVAGAIVEPASGRVWSAARGHGAHCDGQPLRASTATRLELSLVSTGFAYRVQRRRRQAAAVGRLLERVRDIRRAGSASLDLCAVAAGWVDGYVEHGLHRWDWAAGALIASEAGAVVRLPREDGVDVDGLGAGATFAAAPGIADELRAAAVECGIGAVDDVDG